MKKEIKKEKCLCACHSNKFKKIEGVNHDTKCCDEMNGISPPQKSWQEELEKILNDNFPKLNQDNPEIASPNNRSAALVMYAFTKMLIQKTLNEQREKLDDKWEKTVQWYLEDQKQEFKKTLNSGKRMYELGREEFKKELLKSLPKEMKGVRAGTTNLNFQSYVNGYNKNLQEIVKIIKEL